MFLSKALPVGLTLALLALGCGGAGGPGASSPATAPGTSTPRAGGPRVLLNNPAALQALKTALAAPTAPAARFRTMVDTEMASPGTVYGFEARHAALLYQLTGTKAYGTFAVQQTEAFVASEEALIRANQPATIAGDSYLEVGPLLGNVAQVYDWCYDLLTADQQARWTAYMNTTLTNLWHPLDAKWGTASYPWSGWSLDNPSNNYYYSFLEATMLVALATAPENAQAATWRTQFTSKIQNQLAPAFRSDLVGGGSREGTGYGTAMKNLFKLYYLWEKSTGQRLADLTDHARLTALWFAQATVPTLDRLSPLGDHARDSTASLFDYHRELWLSLIAQYPTDPAVRAVKQLLADSSVPVMANRFECWADFIYDRPDVTPLPLSTLPTAYYASGTGNLFTRSAWNTGATYCHLVVGPYTESHAHRDQGSFVLFRGDWLLDDENLRSHSGIEQDELMHNLVRFTDASGTVTMTQASGGATLAALADQALFTYALADTLPVYQGKTQVARSEREFLFLKPGTVVVFDRSDAGANGVSRVFGLNMGGGTPTTTGASLSLVKGAHRVDVTRIAPTGLAWNLIGYGGADFPDGGTRAEAVHATGTTSRFLHIVGTDGDVASAVADSTTDATGVRLTFADGRTALVRFANTGRGGTLELRSAANAVLFSGALPTTVTAPAAPPR